VEEDAPVAAEEEAPAAVEEEAPAAVEEAAVEDTPAAEEAAVEEARRLARRSHRRHLLAQPRALKAFAARRRAILEDQGAAATPAEEETDLTEKPTKACVAADDVLASWDW
jgi:hypothetical protein